MVSVRGEARRTVAPDAVRLSAALSASRQDKQEALRAAGAALDRLTGDLAARGGVPLRAGTERHALTWSAHSATTHPEGFHDERTGRYERSGTVRADVALLVTVRALDTLDDLGAALARHESLAVHDALWVVDADNPAWPEVRAAAIRDAVRKGRDYAAALGGSLAQVEHLADAGLLDSSGHTGYEFLVQQAAARAAMHDGGSDIPSLDPVPQELLAVVEARFLATGLSLDLTGP